MTHPYVSTSTVRFNHTDPAGYVFFPRYFEMIHAAVEDWFTIGLGINYADLINHRRHGLPTAHTECDFTLPTRLGETLELTVYIDRIGNTSVSLLFVGSVRGEERLRAKSVLVNISLDDGQPLPLSEDLRLQMEAYLQRQGEIPVKSGS